MLALFPCAEGNDELQGIPEEGQKALIIRKCQLLAAPALRRSSRPGIFSSARLNVFVLRMGLRAYVCALAEMVEILFVLVTPSRSLILSLHPSVPLFIPYFLPRVYHINT